MHAPLRLHAVLALIVFLAGVTGALDCAENRCLKRVQHQGSQIGNSLYKCNQFFYITYIPAPTSYTKTFTHYSSTTTKTKSVTGTTGSITSSTAIYGVAVTATSTSSPLSITTFQRRQDPGQGGITTSKTTLPPYVHGFCANTNAYSSACSCYGATHSTYTASGSVATISKTVTRIKTKTTHTTAFTTTTPIAEFSTTVTFTTYVSTVTTGTAAPTTCAQPQPTFQLRVYDSYVYYYFQDQEGEFAAVNSGNPPAWRNPAYEKGYMALADQRAATNFTRDANCSLISLEPGPTYGLIGNAFEVPNFIFFAGSGDVPVEQRVRIGFASDSNKADLEVDTTGKVANYLLCGWRYPYGCSVSIDTNDDYGYLFFEKIVP